MSTLKTPEEIFNKHAKAYEEKFMNQALYHYSFDLFCTSLSKKNPRVLEIACGPGNITKYLLDKRPDLNILGIDIAANMVELARINNPQAEFQVMDAKDLSKFLKNFDAVMCGFCLPYLSKEEALKLIKDVSNLLNPGGVFYLSTMEDDYSKSGIRKSSTGDEMIMYYHQPDYLADELEKNCFDILDLRHQNYSDHEGSTAIDLLILAQKKFT